MTVITAEEAEDNREYVRRPLEKKMPGFAALFVSAECQLDQQLLSHSDAGSARESSTRRHADVRSPAQMRRDKDQAAGLVGRSWGPEELPEPVRAIAIYRTAPLAAAATIYVSEGASPESGRVPRAWTLRVPFPPCWAVTGDRHVRDESGPPAALLGAGQTYARGWPATATAASRRPPNSVLINSWASGLCGRSSARYPSQQGSAPGEQVRALQRW
jgi:hypothetical protein